MHRLKHLLCPGLCTSPPLGQCSQRFLEKGLDFSIPAYSCFALTCCISSRCCRTISSTTEGSANVDTSPNSSGLSWATFLRIRRIIFPDRVLGRPDTTYKGKKKKKEKKLFWEVSLLKQIQIFGMLREPNEHSFQQFCVGYDFLRNFRGHRELRTMCKQLLP